MQYLGENNKARARRPYWLLLALALFFAGQVASAEHWHNNAKGIDADCALCMLSSANGAAIVDCAIPFVAVALFAFTFIFVLPPVRGGFCRCYDSRAPPTRF